MGLDRFSVYRRVEDLPLRGNNLPKAVVGLIFRYMQLKIEETVENAFQDGRRKQWLDRVFLEFLWFFKNRADSFHKWLQIKKNLAAFLFFFQACP